MNGNDRGSAAQPRVEPRRHLTRSFLLAAGAVALIFGLYEIIERTWLDGVDMRLLHALHMIRGIVSSLVAAGLVGWSIARSSPSLLATTPSEEEWVRGARPTEDTRLENYARWLILMRWVAVIVAVTLVFIAIWAARLLPSMLAGPLMLTLAALAALNVGYTILLHQGFQRLLLLHIQVYADLVILVVLLHFSGGIENPLYLIMLFHVIIGGIVLSRAQCYLVAAASSVLFGLLALAEWGHVLEHYTLQIFPHFSAEDHILHAAHDPLYVAAGVGLQSMILFVTAYFVSTLVDRLRHDERQLEAMANRALADGQLLERSLETTDTALRVVDRGLKARWSNSRWRTWFGSRAPGSPAAQRLDGAASAARQTLRDGRTRRTELASDDGAERPDDPPGSAESGRFFQVTTAALRDATDRVSQVVELAQDVTEQRRSQARMVRAGQLAAVGELAGQVAHEVNNPIAIISAKARLLLSDHRSELSDTTVEELGKMIDLSDRVAHIAQGLLSYCRPSGAVRVPLDVRTPIRNALAMVEARAKNMGIRIELDLSDHLPTVRANAQEMEQVALNLLLNALDSMPRGGRLTVAARSESAPPPARSGNVVISVEDTGGGIPGSIRKRIFEPFFTTKKEGRGTGLGLSICQGLVRSHGGHIDLESRVDEGSRFTVTLPVDDQTPEQDTDHG